MYEGKKSLDREISKIQEKLEQEDLLQLIGKIMKEAINVTSFEQLVEKTTQILIWGMSIRCCYIWKNSNAERVKAYKLFVRDTEEKEQLKVMRQVSMPIKLAVVEKTQLFKSKDIEERAAHLNNVSNAILAIPIKDLNESKKSGLLVVEHEEADYFSQGIISFFETLSIFIACKANNLRLLNSVSEKSMKDPLTETYNRRHLNEALRDLYAKYGYITVAVIDTDNFKRINDAFGHIEGDMVLKAIAQLAKGSVKESGGEVVRYGGDEFVVIIPKPLGEALHILEEFRKAVHYLKIAYDLDTDISITLGVCSCPEIIKEYKKIIKIADRALLRGKIKGKNRVVLASDEDIDMNE